MKNFNRLKEYVSFEIVLDTVKYQEGQQSSSTIFRINTVNIYGETDYFNARFEHRHTQEYQETVGLTMSVTNAVLEESELNKKVAELLLVAIEDKKHRLKFLYTSVEQNLKDYLEGKGVIR